MDLGLEFGQLMESSAPDVFLGHQARFNRVKPSMTGRANLAVFLYELRDVKRMFEIIPKKHLRSKRGFGFKDWRSALSYANGQHLNYAFGWRPFLSDVKAVWKGLNTFEARLSKFVNMANRDLVLKASDSGEDSGTKVWEGFPRAVLQYTHTYTHHSKFCLSYSVPEYSDRELRTRAMLDTLGLHVNAANVWAVLPWSFVVDWFADVGGYLDEYSEDWLSPALVLSSAMSSVSNVSKGTITLQYGSGAPTQVASVECETYRRRLGFPLNEVMLGDLNSDKIRLLASLVGSRLL